MTELPTVILRGDDERTIVDRRDDVKRTSEPVGRWLRHETRARPRWRTVFGLTVGISACAALSAWALMERRTVLHLQRIVDRFDGNGVRFEERAPQKDPGAPPSPAATLVLPRGSPGRPTPDRLQLERLGARLLGANDYEGALPHYQALSFQYPKEAIYADVVAVIQAKLRCRVSGDDGSARCK